MRTFVRIDKLKVFARHGVLDHEHTVGNLFEISVELEYDFIEAARTDDIALALDYGELTRLVIDEMNRPKKLLESVAMNIKDSIIRRWPRVKGGRVSLTKLHPPIPAPAPQATVIIEF